jgi:hypothetical protein
LETTDDKSLTLFLISCMSGILDGSLKPLSKDHRPSNLNQFKIQQGDLVYLETTATGTNFRSHTDIRVMQGLEGVRQQIWGMQIVSILNKDAIDFARLSRQDVRDFVNKARRLGYERTLDRLARDLEYSLFDIPELEENGLSYHETITDNLDVFTGEETVEFRLPGIGSKKHELFIAYYQGGRL